MNLRRNVRPLFQQLHKLTLPPPLLGQIIVNSRPLARKMGTEVDGRAVFQGHGDRFNGVTVVSSDTDACTVEEFTRKLDDSLAAWKEAGKRGIWFKVGLRQSEWVPRLAQQGFKFHHAKTDYVMMYRWLPENETCNIPPFAHTMIGVGAVVVNEQNQVLVVSEKYHIGKTPYWKLPGGYVEPGENLVDAAIREVYEETNIQTTFDSVLTFRHGHHGMFDCSDIYTVVSLKPESQEISKCEREILECKWMDVQEYLNHPKVHELNRFFLQKYLEYNRNDIKIDCFQGIHQLVNKPYAVYYVTSKEAEAVNKAAAAPAEKESESSKY